MIDNFFSILYGLKISSGRGLYTGKDNDLSSSKQQLLSFKTLDLAADKGSFLPMEKLPKLMNFKHYKRKLITYLRDTKT